ncbi:hypothetical protein H5410_027240 [Solanum commersonii]|uniref:Uncharacterized protein n=1 Tax=Solanum commersonii TaxID=4109 RepID=A0A9J5Z2V4_SOLCO|nr:hypothetical protein H5410_027240 [Solanum commersonii]
MESSNDQSKELTSINPRKAKILPQQLRQKLPRYKALRVVVQVEDLHMVQTPPSVSSSTAITPTSLLLYTNNFHNNNLASLVKPVPERRTINVVVSTISSETCYEVGDNIMNYSTRNKTTNLIKLNDVPHNIGEGFLQAPISKQTITTTTTVTPHMSIMHPISKSLSVCTQSN